MPSIPQPLIDAAVLAGAAVFAVARYYVGRWTWLQHEAKDSKSYLAIGRGEVVTSPYHGRWLLPWLLRARKPGPYAGREDYMDHARRWFLWSFTFQVAGAVLIAALALGRGMSPGQAVAAAVLWVGLAGVFDMQTALPILLDATGYVCALAVGVCAQCECWWGAGLASAALAFVRPVAMPVASLLLPWAWCWLPFAVGVPIVLANGELPHLPRAAYNRWRFLTGYDGYQLVDMFWLVIPWGACLVALTAPDVPTIAALVYGYGSLWLANGTVRIYQVGAPAVVLCAVPLIPVEWLLLVCLAHWCVVSLRSDWRKPCPGL